MRVCSRAAAICGAGDFRGSGSYASQIGFDEVAGNALVEAAGDGLNFGEFGHALLVYKVRDQGPISYIFLKI